MNQLLEAKGEALTLAVRERFPGMRFIGAKHPVVKRGQDLVKNKVPGGGQVAVIGGHFALREAFHTGKTWEALLVCPENMVSLEGWRLVEEAEAKGVPLYGVSAKTLRLLEEGSGAAGLVALVQVPYTSWEALPPEGLLVILDGVEIPGNVGTILRSAEAVGATGVVLYRRQVRITHPKLLRSSLAAAFRVPVVWEDDPKVLQEQLQARGYRLVLADANGGTPYYETAFPHQTALVLGAEKYGISDFFYGLPHESTYIPMRGELDSLNVGVAASILMAEAALACGHRLST